MILYRIRGDGKMDLNLFFSFPGILILIGVVLLLLAIIIGIFAYRNVGKEEYLRNHESDEEQEEDYDLEDQLLGEEEVTFIKQEEPVQENTPVVKKPTAKEAVNSTEDIKPLEEIKEDQEQKEATVVETETVDMIAPYEKEVEHDYIELKDEPFIEEEKLEEPPATSIDENKQVQEQAEEEESKEERVIYGGAKPLENVNLEFNDDVRKPLYQHSNPKDDNSIEELLEITKELKINKKKETPKKEEAKENKPNDQEEIEVL